MKKECLTKVKHDWFKCHFHKNFNHTNPVIPKNSQFTSEKLSRAVLAVTASAIKDN